MVRGINIYAGMKILSGNSNITRECLSRSKMTSLHNKDQNLSSLPTQLRAHITMVGNCPVLYQAISIEQIKKVAQLCMAELTE